MAKSKYKEGITEVDELDVEILNLLTQGQDPSTAKSLIEIFRQDFTSEDCTRTLATILVALISPHNKLLDPTLRSNCINFVARISILLKAVLYTKNNPSENASK